MAAPLEGKVALITGGSKGIGRATALRLARDGAKVVVNYSSDSAAAEEVVNELGGSEKAIAVKADMADSSTFDTLIRTTVDKFGRIDVLVLNAGVMALKDFADVTEELYNRTMNINVKGPFFLTQKAAPHMPEGSHVVLFSTTLAHASTVTPNYLTYVMGKGAIEQMTRVLAKDFGKKGIRVNCVAPGPTATDLFLRGKSEQLLRTIAGFNPIGRIGKPEEIADVVAFLGSPASSWMNGQVLKVNGGMA